MNKDRVIAKIRAYLDAGGSGIWADGKLMVPGDMVEDLIAAVTAQPVSVFKVAGENGACLWTYARASINELYETGEDAIEAARARGFEIKPVSVRSGFPIDLPHGMPMVMNKSKFIYVDAGVAEIGKGE